MQHQLRSWNVSPIRNPITRNLGIRSRIRQLEDLTLLSSALILRHFFYFFLLSKSYLPPLTLTYKTQFSFYNCKITHLLSEFFNSRSHPFIILYGSKEVICFVFITRRFNFNKSRSACEFVF